MGGDDRACAWCDGSMVGKTRKARFCSRRCQLAAYEARRSLGPSNEHRVVIVLEGHEAKTARWAATASGHPDTGSYLAALVTRHLADLAAARLPRKDAS